MDLTDDRLLDVANLFDIAGKAVKVAPCGNGLINDTFVITTGSGDMYVLQRINTAVFKNPAALQRNLKSITAHIRRKLDAAGVKDPERRTLTPVMTAGGQDYLSKDGSVWRMTEYIAGSRTLDKVNPQTAMMTGKAFARFHAYFAGPDAPELEETIPDFHNIAFRIRRLKEAVDENRAGRLDSAGDLAGYLLGREEEMLMANRMHDEGRLPKRIAHCDTKVNNILFDDKGDILCVIDLDTTMPGFVLSDFGDFIRTAANTGEEDDKDLDRIGVDMEIFRNFAEGYVGEAYFLTPAERETLPFGAKMLTYMQAVRFLTDYIEGDCYYKTEYAEHNLVRTRAQVRLLRDIDRRLPEMEDFVRNIRHDD